MASRAFTPILTGGALVAMALAFAYTRRPSAHALAPFQQRSRALARATRDLDPLGPDEALALTLARAARFKPSPRGEGEAMASTGATWPFLEALDACATEPGESRVSIREAGLVTVDTADPGEALFDPNVQFGEPETPPTDPDPATVGDSRGFGTDLPIARFEEADDAIAPEDLGTEWLERAPSPRHRNK